MVLPFSALSLLTGYLISRVGSYTPFLILGVCIIAVGAGLLTTLQVNSSTGAWVGYQVLYGVGLGFAGQIPSMAAYTVLSKENVGIGASLMFFGFVIHSILLFNRKFTDMVFTKFQTDTFRCNLRLRGPERSGPAAYQAPFGHARRGRCYHQQDRSYKYTGQRPLGIPSVSTAGLQQLVACRLSGCALRGLHRRPRCLRHGVAIREEGLIQRSTW